MSLGPDAESPHPIAEHRLAEPVVPNMPRRRVGIRQEKGAARPSPPPSACITPNNNNNIFKILKKNTKKIEKWDEGCCTRLSTLSPK